jgi:ATP-binding cassette subfamily B protein
LFLLFFLVPLGVGWSLSQAFTALEVRDAAAVYRWTAAFVALEIGRMATLHWAVMVWTRVWMQMQTFLRANLLAAQVASGGPEAGQPIGSAGEAITHFRDDAEDVARLVDGMVDVSAGLVFTVLAAFVLGSASSAGAAVLIGPLVAVAIATKALDARIKRYRTSDREATAAVTGLVGDVMAAATTVKVNGAAGAMLARLRRLVDRRRQTAVQDRVLEEAVSPCSWRIWGG